MRCTYHVGSPLPSCTKKRIIRAVVDLQNVGMLPRRVLRVGRSCGEAPELGLAKIGSCPCLH